VTFGGDVVDPGEDHSVVKTIVQAEDVTDKGRVGSVLVQRRRYTCSSVDVSIWTEE